MRKCPYCDFNSHPLRATDDMAAYCDALIQDWRAQAEHLAASPSFRTAFLGGGTPSLCKPDLMHAVLQSLPLVPAAEVTMEANPGATEHHDFAAYLAAGINRLSIGAQSFDDDKLARLGRIHSAADTIEAFHHARAGGFENINLDLMWGLPQQTVAQGLSDLHQAIELAPEHISWYQLTIEAKTEFARRTPILPVEGVLAELERQGLKLLADAGYVRYEISAFAREGRQCLHNVNYWTFGDYVGIGAGAHGKQTELTPLNLAIRRTRKASQPRLYLSHPSETEYDDIPSTARMLEFMLNALRLVDGVPFACFEARTGLAWSRAAPIWDRLQCEGLVRHDRCAATAMGLRYLDSVVAAFLE